MKKGARTGLIPVLEEMCPDFFYSSGKFVGVSLMVITLGKLPLLLTPLTYIHVGKDAKHAKKLLVLLNKLINSTSNAILHEGFTEIQQITQPHPCETEVAEQLFLVCIVEFLNTLGLYNN